MEQRLQKLLSAAGVCSRRSAERYITEGRVKVNGVPAQLGMKADPERDEITVDGTALPQTEKRVWLMLNKPAGRVTTLSDEKGRKTAAELVAGLILNVWLGLGIWDYSGLWGNLWGQICPRFALLWCVLAVPAIVIFDWWSYLFGCGERPRYRLI